MALLSLDPGLRRCGYALCRDARRGGGAGVEALGWVTSAGGAAPAPAPAPPPAPLPPAAERALALPAAVALRLAAAHGARGVVVGHPLDPLGGRSGAACAFAEALAARLQAAASSGGPAVLLWDERGSSVRARQGLRSARLAQRGGARPRAHLPAALGGQVDQAAATVILESFLCAHAPLQ